MKEKEKVELREKKALKAKRKKDELEFKEKGSIRSKTVKERGLELKKAHKARKKTVLVKKCGGKVV